MCVSEIQGKTVEKDQFVSLFTVSNQKWKYVLLIILLVLQIILFTFMFWALEKPGAFLFEIFSISNAAIVVITLGHFIFIFFPWATFSLRCPACHKSMVWHIMRKVNQKDFINVWMQMLHTSCPACRIEYALLSRIKKHF